MSGTALRRLAVAAAVLAPATGALAADAAPWPASFVGRLEALALIESLNADLLAHDSATLTLERWCADHRLADPALIVAERVHDVDKPATAEVRAALDVKPDEPLGYRRVRLKCGDESAFGGRQLVCAGAADAGHEPRAGDDRHAVRQGGRGAPFPPPHAFGGLALAAAAERLGNGRGGGRGRKGRARGPRSCARAPRGAVDARRRAVQRGGRDLYRRGAGLPAAEDERGELS